MAVYGPVPKRSDELIRRNIDDRPLDKVEASGKVPVPPLGIVDAHPVVKNLYESMKKSAQAKFYEPTDWAYALMAFHFINQQLWAGKPSAQMLASINQMLSSLLLTEADRRRVRIEIERAEKPAAKVISASELFRQRLNGTGR